MARTLVVGLTGGIASGKSTVARMLVDLGARVVDADLLARQVVRPGEPAHREIAEAFGLEVLLPDGTIDRKRLGALVFGDEAARQRLNAIVHPRIAEAAQRAIAAHAADGAPVVFYEAALLVENGLHRMLDGLVVVSVPPEVQLARLATRDGLDEEAARARLAAQLPLEAKLAVATDVIDTTGPHDATFRQVERVWERWRSRSPT